MYTLLIPLGTIVRTDSKLSIAMFQQLATRLHLGINVVNLLDSLSPIFAAYNTGKINEAEFASELIAIVATKVLENTDSRPIDNWQAQWGLEWRNAWNAMVKIDERCIKLLELIAATPGVRCLYYSNTNPTHLDYLARSLPQLPTKDIFATFKLNKNIAELLSNVILPSISDLNINSCGIVVGNPNHVEAKALKKTAVANHTAILQAVEGKCTVFQLEDPCFSLDNLQEILNLVNPDLAIETVATGSKLQMG